MSLLFAGRAVLPFVLTALGCVPERELSSYRSGSPGSDEAAPILAGTPSIGDDEAGADAGPAEPRLDEAVDAALLDATPSRGLACRAECVCEPRDGLDFMFCATLVTFQVASDRCAGAGGTLASVGDDMRNAWLTQRMQGLASDDFWLSGTDADTEGVWRWADGTIFFDLTSDAGPRAFAPWDTLQPNDLNGEDCMRSTAGIWRDLDCGDTLSYVCQG
jgi:hypothetical protein